MTLRDIIDLVLDFQLIYLVFVFTVPLFAYLGYKLAWGIFFPKHDKMNSNNPLIIVIAVIVIILTFVGAYLGLLIPSYLFGLEEEFNIITSLLK